MTLPRHRTCAHTKYKLTCRDFDELRQATDGQCWICEAHEQDLPGSTLYVDHDASVGPWAVRGLLCNRCNSCLDLPLIEGPKRDAYLANAWYLRHPDRLVAPAPRPLDADFALTQLDEVTAQARQLGWHRCGVNWRRQSWRH